MDTGYGIETEYLRVLELTRRANLMSQKITSGDVLFKPILRVPKAYLAQLDKQNGATKKEEDIVGVLQETKSELEVVMSVADFETKLEVIEKMGRVNSEPDSVDNDYGDPFFSMQEHTLIGVASVPLNCIQSPGVVEWELPIVSPSGLMSGKLAVNFELLYVESGGRQISVTSGERMPGMNITVDSQICLKVDILHVKDLPIVYGNFLFGQYDLFNQSDPTIFYGEDRPILSPFDDRNCEISVEFNHCQMHIVQVTTDIYNMIDHGYFVIELWGHHGASFAPLAAEDQMESDQNHVQLWLQVLEKSSEEAGDYQPALVEDDPLTDTGGIIVLSKEKEKRLRVQVVSQSKKIKCEKISSIAVTKLSKESTTPQQVGVQAAGNMISFAWPQSEDTDEADGTTVKGERKLSHPTLVPVVEKKMSLRQNSSLNLILKPKQSQMPPDSCKQSFKKKSGSIKRSSIQGAPFLERRMSYPGTITSCVTDDVHILQLLKSKRNNEATAAWNDPMGMPASCAANWFCEVVVNASVYNYKLLELVLRKRLCIKLINQAQIDNYTSFITGVGGRKIGTKCGVLFEISSEGKSKKNTGRRRSSSVTYIEISEGENPDTVFVKRLQHIKELHKRHTTSHSLSPLDSVSSEQESSQESMDNKTTASTSSRRRLSRQDNFDVLGDKITENIIEEIITHSSSEDEHNSLEKLKQDTYDESSATKPAEDLSVGQRVIVQHGNRYLFGYIRFIGKVSFTGIEQIGIELDKPYGKSNGTVDGVTYFQCRNKHGMFSTRSCIQTDPSK